MTYRKRRAHSNLQAVVLVICALFCVGLVHSDDSVSPYIEYYRHAFDDVLAAAYDFGELERYCEVKFPEECGDLNLDHAAMQRLTNDLTLFRSVFTGVSVRAKQLKFTNILELRKATTALRNSSLNKLLIFELEFAARYAAALESCGKPATKAWFDNVVGYDLKDFWRLDSAQQLIQQNIINDKKAIYVRRFDDKGGKTLCGDARALGTGLSFPMYDKARAAVSEQNREFDKMLIEEGFVYVYKIAFLLNDEVQNGSAVKYWVKHGERSAQ